MSSTKTTGASAVALAVVALGIGVVFTTTQISVPPSHAKVGPSLFPYTIGAALIMLGGLLFADARRGRWKCEATDPEAPKPDVFPMAWVLGGLLVNLVLISVIGFILSSTAMFVLVAKGFGTRKPWLAAVIGFVLAFIAYFGFAQLLGLRMGSGLIEDML